MNSNTTKETIILDPKLFGRLPMDIIREHIMPFAYRPKPKLLLRDIRSFYADWNLLENYYIGQYNYRILANDIVDYCNEITQSIYKNCDMHDYTYDYHLSSLGITSYKDIFVRNITHKDKFISLIHVYKTMLNYIMRFPKILSKRNIWIVFGLMTPIERTNFINIYVLTDDEYY